MGKNQITAKWWRHWRRPAWQRGIVYAGSEGGGEMRIIRVTVAILVPIALALTCNPQAPAQPPVVVLRDQPASPLEIISMQPAAMPARSNLPPHILQAVADYQLEVRNKSRVPIMAYAIRHEARGTCQASMWFSEPAIGAGETKILQSRLTREGPTITPVVDFVLLQNGTYYGADTCGTLRDYTTRLDERRSMLQVILRRLEQDGPDKTAAWIKRDLSVDVSALRSPTKMK